jgi:hypothetical protein
MHFPALLLVCTAAVAAKSVMLYPQEVAFETPEVRNAYFAKHGAITIDRDIAASCSGIFKNALDMADDTDEEGIPVPNVPHTILKDG